jgi:hypothetical protein
MADTTQAPSGPAQAQVFATTELLELILLALDPITLFAIQRVCKQWRGLIADSHRLQEHMFLRAPACVRNKSNPKRQLPRPTTTISSTHTAENHDHKNNDCIDKNNDDATSPPSLETVSLSPILAPATQYIHTPHPNQLGVTCTQTTLLSSSSSHTPSWHNMYLSSPACKSATVALWWTLGDSMRGSVYLESLAGPSSDNSAGRGEQGGLKFKDVIEAALAMRTGKWKRLPGGEVLPLSAVGRDVCLGEFLEGAVRGEGIEDGEEVEATSLFVLSF